VFAGINSVRNSDVVRAAGLGVGAATTALAVVNRRPFEPNQLIPQKLVFPRDLPNYPLSMSFDIMQYKRRSIFNQPYIKPKGTIRLPVAKNIADKFSMNWTDHSQSPIVGATVEQILSTGNFNGNMLDNIKTAAAGVGSAAQGFVQGLGIEETRRTAADLGKSLETNLSLSDIIQPLGLAENPFLTVLFKQPSFKEHNFSWKFIPRDPEEARIINKIITIFKWALLPDIATETSGTLMNYPHMIQVGFFGGDNYLYRFKPCVITSFTANYAPAQTPSFFKGSQNVPTEIDVSMNLKEIEYWTKVDFDPAKEPTGPNDLPVTGGYSPNNP
jgi:hypothetical protein